MSKGQILAPYYLSSGVNRNLYLKAWSVNNAYSSVLSHDISGQGRSSVSVTHDHAIIIPGVNEELEPQSLKSSQWQ